MITLHDAKRLLGLEPGLEYGESDIRRLFADRARAAHPDTGTGKCLQQWSMKELQDARDVLLSALVTPQGACGNCHGSGKVRIRWGALTCGTCGGTGETR